ncbi:MAG: hypothetical protein LVQ97_02400 [Candidatus Micrarchaeales archaeon]|jgi:hypothetical protein|uniref:Uncharacterized protein n=1 Tax=Candidatus Micrarchaeum acidiphilum ARMAN-2 TaxID=425595 RepID=C7DII3_MICA2|nr:MAG: hypothetical protein UNLARM2_0871 [Candidatus Micrarchaeum acidiphilum ARMAN-2]MCW6161012.1 hypothetical protein [Candidatus Micrarchaeales archaeon]
MPYIPAEDRPVLDKAVDALSESIVNELVGGNDTTDISVLYRHKISEILVNLCSMETGGWPQKLDTPAGKLGEEIFKISEKYNYKGAWLGELNYALTRLIQEVPKKMVESGRWKEEFRYWIYAQTAGALERSALHWNEISMPPGAKWVADGFVGVLFDVKDEYKRRVNAAYEAFQIRKSGDVYTTPYKTELVENKGGFQEIMKQNKKEETVIDAKKTPEGLIRAPDSSKNTDNLNTSSSKPGLSKSKG